MGYCRSGATVFVLLVKMPNVLAGDSKTAQRLPAVLYTWRRCTYSTDIRNSRRGNHAGHAAVIVSPSCTFSVCACQGKRFLVALKAETFLEIKTTNVTFVHFVRRVN